MLKVENISCKVSGKMLLENISAAFEPGKLHLIIGPNGAGKSTLIKIISGQLKPLKGSIFYGTSDIGKLSIRQLARTRAVLSQHIELAFSMSARAVVMMGRYPHFTGKPTLKDETACKEAIAFFQLDELADRDYLTLSGGEKQRVNFARVMAQIWYPQENSNRYLLLDEPLTFLDVYYQIEFLNQIKKMHSLADMIVIGVIHDLNLAARFADQLVLLHSGKILSSGQVKEVLTAANLKAAFRVEPKIIDEGNYLQCIF